MIGRTSERKHWLRSKSSYRGAKTLETTRSRSRGHKKKLTRVVGKSVHQNVPKVQRKGTLVIGWTAGHTSVNQETALFDENQVKEVGWIEGWDGLTSG